MIRRTSLALVLACSSFAATARAEVVTLESLEASALADDPGLESHEQRAAASEAHIDAIRAEALPRLSLDAGATMLSGSRVARTECGPVGGPSRQCTIITSPRLSDGFDAYVPSFRLSTGLRLDGVMYDFGRTRARIAAAQAEADASDDETSAQREAILRNVRATYLEWFGAFQRRRFVELAVASAEARVQSIDSARELGVRSVSDRDAASIELARVRLELSRARSAEADARLVAARTSHAAIPDDAEPDPALLELSVPLLPRPRPMVVDALERRRDAVDAAVRAHQLRHAPFLTASLRLGVTSTLVPGADAVAFPAYSLDVGITVPLWDPRTSDHVLAEARAQQAALTAASEDALATSTLVDERARLAVAAADTELEMTAELERMCRDRKSVV